MHMKELPMFTLYHLQFRDGLPAPRFVMSIIVSSYQLCDEQQFEILSCALYTFFFSNKATFSHTGTSCYYIDYILALEKTVYASRVSCFYIEINIFEHFCFKFNV